MESSAASSFAMGGETDEEGDGANKTCKPPVRKKPYTVNGNLTYTQTIFFYNIHNLLIDSTASFMGVFIKFQ